MQSILNKVSLPIFSLLLILSCSDSKDDQDQQNPLNLQGPVASRILVADGLEPILKVVDLGEGKVLQSIPTSGTSRVYTGETGRFAYAIQMTENKVNIVDGGLWFENGVQVQDNPRLMETSLEGPLPIHFVAKAGYAAIFFDEGGIAQFIPESLEDGLGNDPITIDSGAPHHGVALAFGDHFLVSKPLIEEAQEGGLPVGIQVFNQTGNRVGQNFEDCPALHGEAATDKVVAFGCGDGVLMIEEADEGLKSYKVAPSELGPEDKGRVGTLVAHNKAPYIVGNFGKNRYVEIDPSTKAMTIREMSMDYSRFKFSSDGRYLIFLGRDGTLGVLDVETRELIHQSKVTSESTGENHGAIDPQITVGQGFVFISNPRDGEVVVFDLISLSIKKVIQIGGTPTMLTSFGSQ
ncbi:cytochrome D1 domain-containing protein [Pseudobacteriovorax antillogorgiicola]|uniref:DNA-binding beta-propeller fold protein YncE n=1 Tax=Pseudobacteriovorax antillogorgiicola TaxID=1513793 RepID=A0A1Y6C901_9BACT|nr:cytochrome D1 domain-containing protein [Pseudobacteriovorax antillogorgiicola]TCS51786.1 hypothetical protein EDD56_110171 [Pseudobacteriovorax antillogorgiicola]SMF49986.1 hypothetical protein SAMN06296036_115140 [Pseudobacteriovorax antillogorgiicola]